MFHPSNRNAKHLAGPGIPGACSLLHGSKALAACLHTFLETRGQQVKITRLRRMGKCKRCTTCCTCVICTVLIEKCVVAPRNASQQYIIRRRADVVPVMGRLGFKVLKLEEVDLGTKEWKRWAVSLRCSNLVDEKCQIHHRKPFFCRKFPCSPEASKQVRQCGFKWKRTKLTR